MKTTQKTFVYGEHLYTVFAWGEILIQRKGSDNESSSVYGYGQLHVDIQAKVKEVIRSCQFNEEFFI